MFSFYIIILYAVLAILKPTRKVALALTPWLIFACSYDWMRLLPNYEVNPIDVKGLYESEKTLFGINADGTTLIPCEYFAIHHCVPADIMAGLFYLCWVPVPLGCGIYLYAFLTGISFCKPARLLRLLHPSGSTAMVCHELRF